MSVQAERERFGRYRVLGLLGAGANGLVYRVEDTEQNAPVALKVLRAGLGQAADLKREFRLVSDLTHPNLVLPYALETDGDEVFFTMELVNGKPIVTWLASDDETAESRADRIRSAFRQVAEALLALHARGLLHRDIKPSNILVEPSGRVALLDFGLVRRIDGPIDHNHLYFAGSPAYLAPEVLTGTPASTASDAYALGVVLHEVLTGTWPYHDDLRESVTARMRERAAPKVTGASEELAAVCRGLLETDPAKRLDLPAMVQALSPEPISVVRMSVSPPVVERDDELARLASAWSQVKASERPVIIHLPGQSGMGKSALLRSFGRRMNDTAWVLEGRAYERDTVPFKALDAAMDQLAQKIEALSDEERGALAPSQPEALHILFPALGTAMLAEAGARAAAASTDPVARRRAGARALSELLSKVSESYGLVLMLDDLQWGDLDSARLLIDLLAPPAPALLLLLSYRSELEAPFLALYKRWEVENVASETVPVKPLTPEGARALATTLAASGDRAESIAKDSDGCPFLIEMLLSAPEHAHGFDAALGYRLDTLTESARRMLEAVCVAARPIARAHVPFAPERATDAFAAWAALVSGRLLRSEGSGSNDSVEVYHDRIRDAVTRKLSADERKATHLALGEAFERATDAEGAAVHLAAAGDTRRAFTHAETAASAALDALAFDRAAQLLALCLECAPDDAAVRRDLTLRRARALANAGRGAEAAPLFLECATTGGEIESLNLRREAMEQYLVAGRLDEGRPVMRALLSDLGVWLPESSWVINGALYAEVGRLLVRGAELGRSRTLSERERLLLDTFGSVGKGLTAFDASLGSWFFLRAARLALDWGEPQLAARGVTYLASLLGFSGKPSDVERARKWLDAGEAIAKRYNDEHAFAFCQVSRGMVECCAGQWAVAIELFDAAAAVFDARFSASDWESNLAKCTSLFSVAQAGHYQELELRASDLTREARERGDLAVEVEANLYLSPVALTRDNVEDAYHYVDRNLRLWTVRGYHFQHWIGLRYRTLAHLYEGRYAEALAGMDDGMPRAKSANLTAMQVVRVEAYDLHGRAAVGVAWHSQGRERRRAMMRVEEDIRRLEKEARPHAIAPAEVLRAGLALVEGDRRRAVRFLEDADRAYESAAMHTHALTARYHVARLRSDEHGLARVTAELRAANIVEPERWARTFLPLVDDDMKR